MAGTQTDGIRTMPDTLSSARPSSSRASTVEPRAASPRALPPNPPAKLLVTDVGALALATVIVTIGIWVRVGGVSQLTKGAVHAWTSLTQLTGLFASLAGLFGLALVARPRAIERRFGLDRVFIWHRYLGEAMALLIGAHIATALAATVGSPDGGVWGAVRDYSGRLPYMAGALVGSLLIGIVTVSSLRSVRQQLAYETWYFVHLLAYVGFALSFGHEIVQGGLFADDFAARAFWVLLHVAVGLVLVWGRWGRLVVSARRPLHVVSTTAVGPDTVELTLGGPALADMTGDAGQFALLRPLTPSLWWQAHPFSLSAAPTEAGLRFTVKGLGDASVSMRALPVGTKVLVEGPYGACTTDVVAGEKLLFVAGGVGIAPVRALLERLDASSAPIVLYRAHRGADLVHLDDIKRLVAERGGSVRTLVGPTAKLAVKDPFSAKMLTSIVPDLLDRSAVLCGPERLVFAARAGLLAAGMRRDHIHYERPWW